MTKPELGVKRDCPECGARFYDLNKEPAHCPNCDHEFMPEALLKPRRARPQDGEAEPAPEKKAEPVTSLETADKEAKPVKGARKAALDEDETDDDDEDDELAAIEDIDIDDDDDDDDDADDALLVNDDDDDVSDIVPASGGGEG